MADKKVARLLDANLNRAREGLRVVEDTARFIWNDASLYKRLRRLRHGLQKAAAPSIRQLVEARDSVNDSGREMKEYPRASLSDVVAANLKRAQEAMRVLEEYGKVYFPETAGSFKKIRYQLYLEEKRIMKRI